MLPHPFIQPLTIKATAATIIVVVAMVTKTVPLRGLMC